jgi:predicted acylesterase/phospholipase RssA
MKKVGFVLSGGGFNGGFQAGVMHQLYMKGITPDIMYGTSVGAVNAVGYAWSGATELIGMWKLLKRRSDIISFDFSSALRLQGLYSLKPLRRLLFDLYTADKVGMGNVVICYTDLTTQRPVYADSRHEAYITPDYIIASCSIPGAVAPWKGRYVDGSVTDPLPLKKAIADNCTDIYIILNEPLQREDWTPTGYLNVLSYVLHSSHILTHELIMYTLDTVRIPISTTIHLYAPESRKYSSLDFSRKSVHSLISEGQVAEEYNFWRQIVHEYFIVEV